MAYIDLVIEVFGSDRIGSDGYEYVDEGEFYEYGLPSLTDKQQKVISLRFGLCEEEKHTRKRISEILGITENQAREIEMKVLRKLRHPNSEIRKPEGRESSIEQAKILLERCGYKVEKVSNALVRGATLTEAKQSHKP